MRALSAARSRSSAWRGTRAPPRSPLAPLRRCTRVARALPAPAAGTRHDEAPGTVALHHRVLAREQRLAPEIVLHRALRKIVRLLRADHAVLVAVGLGRGQRERERLTKMRGVLLTAVARRGDHDARPETSGSSSAPLALPVATTSCSRAGSAFEHRSDVGIAEVGPGQVELVSRPSKLP